MLKIVFTTDIHGYFFPTDYLDKDIKEVGLFRMLGGFQKDGNTLIVDGGDILQGSAFVGYSQKEIGGFGIVANIMNKCGYDYITLGNHDFNYGLGLLRSYIDNLNAKCLCENLEDRSGSVLFPYELRKLDSGLVVGIMGIVTDYVNIWEKSENIEGIAVRDPFEAARKALGEMKKQANITVCLYHGGIEKDLETGHILSETTENIACKICSELDFDILLTGHQHTATPGRWYEGTYIIQAPSGGKGYAYLEIELGDSGLIVNSEIRSANGEAQIDSFREFTEIEHRVQKWLDEPAGTLREALLLEDRIKMAISGSPLADFLNEIQIHYSGAQLSAVSLANDVQGIPKEVSRRDILAAYPYPNTFVVLEISGSQLRTAVERSAEYLEYGDDGRLVVSESFLLPKAEHYNYDFYSGIDIKVDFRLPKGSRVTGISYQGKQISDSDIYSICVNNYRATGAGGYDVYRECRVLSEVNTEMTDLMLDYIENVLPRI